MGVLINEETAALPAPPPPRRRLRQCCCGCSLQTGCIVIGTWTLINAICTLYVSITSLMVAPRHTIEIREKETIIYSITLLYGTLLLSTSLSLIYGADKKRISLMRFWVYFRYVELVLVTCLAVFYMVQLTQASYIALVVGICIFTLGIGIIIYTISVVQNFCSQVKEEMHSLNEDLFVSKL